MSIDSAGWRASLRNFWQSNFGAGIPARKEDVQGLWADPPDAQHTTAGAENYLTVVLEQYKIYVEMADRISVRRGVTNTFYLSLNTAILAAAGAGWEGLVKAPFWLLIGPLIALVAACLSWHWLVRSYRQLNNGKYAVIGALEERLPASPYFRGEWAALGMGRSKARYWPFTHVEQYIPLIFLFAYLFSFVAFAVT